MLKKDNLYGIQRNCESSDIESEENYFDSICQRMKDMELTMGFPEKLKKTDGAGVVVVVI